jgi:hypothetical protein
VVHIGNTGIKRVEERRQTQMVHTEKNHAFSSLYIHDSFLTVKCWQVSYSRVREVGSSSVSQEILCLLWYPKFIIVFRRARDSNRWTQYTSNNLLLLLSFFVCIGRPCDILPSDIPTAMFYAYFPMHAIYCIHLNPSDRMTQIIFGDEIMKLMIMYYVQISSQTLWMYVYAFGGFTST